MRFNKLAIAVVLAMPSAMTMADGLVYQLPKDGSSVRYDLEISQAVNGVESSIKGTLSVSSVGQTTIDNDKCRWIEFKMIMKVGGQEQIVIAKALVPEKHLAKGKAPGDGLIRAWVKQGDQEAIELKDLKHPQAGPLAAFLGGPLKNPRMLEKVEIDGKLGKLACEGVTGDHEFEQGDGTIGLSVENRLHEKSPFGIVTANWKFERKNNGLVGESGNFKLAVVETSFTALTELPDKN